MLFTYATAEYDIVTCFLGIAGDVIDMISYMVLKFIFASLYPVYLHIYISMVAALLEVGDCKQKGDSMMYCHRRLN